MVRVSTHIGRFTKHPDVVRRLPCEAARHGSVIVQFTINRAGQVSGAYVFQSAKIRDLDQAVVAAVKLASPVPAPPASLPGASLKLRLPVAFSSNCTSSMDGG
jgi:protein TonB